MMFRFVFLLFMNLNNGTCKSIINLVPNRMAINIHRFYPNLYLLKLYQIINIELCKLDILKFMIVLFSCYRLVENRHHEIFFFAASPILHIIPTFGGKLLTTCYWQS